MKRFILSIASLLIVSAAALANPITPRQAQQIAKSLFERSPLRSSAPITLSYTRTSQSAAATLRSTAAGAAQNYYYVFNRGNNEGFAIIAADDRAPEVLAYSYKGHLDLNRIPTDAAWFILRYDTAMAQILSGTDRASAALQNEKIIGSPIAPLLDKEGIAWNQGAPFNDKCPTFGGGNRKAYTGCVATALSQILRFHKFPKQAKGSVSYTDRRIERSMTLGQQPYDWANMLPHYDNDGKNATVEQRNAVAQLMVEVGFATKMSYAATSDGASATFNQYVPDALRKHFNCSNSVHAINRYSVSDDVWKQTIYKELQANRPVFYGGKAETTNGGHAFVCDGYDANGLFHFNWGWGGLANGYYRLDVLKPSLLGIGAGIGNYSGLETIVVGIQEKTSESEPFYYPKPDLVVRYKNNNGTRFDAQFKMLNASTETLTGQTKVVLVKGNKPSGAVVKTLQEPQSYTMELYNDPQPINITVQAQGLEDGTYAVTPLWKTNGDSDFRIMNTVLDEPQYIVVNVTGGRFSKVDYDTPLDDIALVANSFQSDLNAYGKSTFSVELKNSSSRLYYGMVKYSYTIQNSGSFTINKEPILKLIQLPGNSTTRVTFEIDQFDCAAGKKATFHLVLPTLNAQTPTSFLGFTSDRLNNPVEVGEGTCKAASSYTLPTYVASCNVPQGQPIVYNTALKDPCTAQFTIKNLGTAGQERLLVAVLYYTYSNKEQKLLSDNEEALPIEAGSSFTFTPKFDKGSLRDLITLKATNLYIRVYAAKKNKDQYILDAYTPIMGDAYRTLELVKKQSVEQPHGTQKSICYPNPADSYTVINCGEGTTSVDLFNLNGTHIATYNPRGAHQIKLDTSRLPEGTYLVGVRQGSSVSTVKLQIQH